MSELKLSPPKVPVITGWQVVMLKDEKYKKHPRKFQAKVAAEEFADLMRKTKEYEKVEVREIYKMDGL